MRLDQRPRRLHGLLQAQHRGGRRSGAVQRPRQPAEGDHAGAHGSARKSHEPAERETALGRGGAQRPEHNEVGGEHQQQAPNHRTLAQARCLPAELEQTASLRPETIDNPAGQPEEPQFFRRRRFNRELVAVIRMTLRRAHLVGISVAPYSALAQQPVRGQPGAREQERRPPGEACEHDRRGKTADEFHQPSGDEVHRDKHGRSCNAEIEIAGHREVSGELGIFKVAHAWWTDTGGGEPIVEPGGGSASKVGADGLVNRRQHLQQNEHDPDQSKWRGQASGLLDCLD